MIVIGILGGVGSGKSAVSDRLTTLGAVVLDADQLGHEVLRQPEVKAELRRRWGETVMDAAGEIDRRKVAEIVFAATPQGREELAFLEQLTHPRIKQRLQTQLAELNVAGVRAAVLTLLSCSKRDGPHVHHCLWIHPARSRAPESGGGVDGSRFCGS